MEAIITIIGQFATLGLLTFGMFKGYFSDNKKQDTRLSEIETTCRLKTKAIDNDMEEIKSNLMLIKENHLKHIEDRIGAMEIKQTEVITILNERLPK